MASVASFFATQIYEAHLPVGTNARLLKVCRAIAGEDIAGQRWAKKHGYRGYTSYASLNDLPRRAPEFDDLKTAIDGHVRRFSRALQFTGPKLELNSMWINILEPDGIHTAHIHPHSAISGTYYVSVPRGASSIKFEDPRLPLMMAAPAKKETARDRPFVTIAPRPGTLLLWESWLRHEVQQNEARGARVSVSFNYS